MALEASASLWARKWWRDQPLKQRFEELPWLPELVDPRKGMLGGDKAVMRLDKIDLEVPTLLLSKAMGLGWEPIPVPKLVEKRVNAKAVAQAERDSAAFAAMGLGS